MIDKELLSLVLEDKDIKEIDNNIKNNELSYLSHNYSYSEWKYINLDTLGRLCKEWCYDNGYRLQCEYDYPIQSVIVFERHTNKETIEEWAGDTELEAIIKATEWVAKEKGLL